LLAAHLTVVTVTIIIIFGPPAQSRRHEN